MLLLPGGSRSAGGNRFPPLRLQCGANVAVTSFASHMMGIRSIMGAINIIATVLHMRAPGMDLLKMLLFAWSWKVTAFLLHAGVPVVAGAVTMLLPDEFHGTGFFNAAGVDVPGTYLPIIWVFEHPEVSSMILPP